MNPHVSAWCSRVGAVCLVRDGEAAREIKTVRIAKTYRQNNIEQIKKYLKEQGGGPERKARYSIVSPGDIGLGYGCTLNSLVFSRRLAPLFRNLI